MSGGKVLVMREQDQPYTGLWVLPGGYPQPGESLPAAAEREAAEELGVVARDVQLLGVYEDPDPALASRRIRRVVICYRAEPVSGAEIVPSREAVDFAWSNPDRASFATAPVFRLALASLALRTR
ncbi:MAG TPA: NUDIX domain-containing protein [Thermoplasmata archaeon]|nr:NUDIX domain-containing protein [Thermoplasmata archaeon]